MFFHKITIHKLFGLVFRICKIAQFHFFRGVTIIIVQLHVFGSISAVTFIIVLIVSLDNSTEVPFFDHTEPDCVSWNSGSVAFHVP